MFNILHAHVTNLSEFVGLPFDKLLLKKFLRFNYDRSFIFNLRSRYPNTAKREFLNRFLDFVTTLIFLYSY